MGESNLHKYLKMLGIKYLDEQGCRLVATEIYIRKAASDDFLNGNQELIERIEKYSRFENWEQHLVENPGNDSKWVIDVLGIGSKDILAPDEKWTHIIPNSKKKVGEETVIRGIEVKVSRSDFKNGYVQTGLDYHYLLCPELLVKKSEIPKHFGLLYWDGGTSVYCAKRPRRMELNTEMMEHYRKKIYQRYHSQIMDMTRDQIRFLQETVNTKQKG